MGSAEESQREQRPSKPPGITIFEHATRSTISFRACQAIVLIITFFSYASYHASRKTTSVVKSTLDPKSTKLGVTPWPNAHLFRSTQMTKSSPESGWAPFNGPDGTQMLGVMDLAFLSLYSIGMFFAGHLGDRLDLRLFLTVGMLGTGFFTALFGLAYWLNIHSFYFFLVVQMLAGLFQSTGWPSVVAVVGNWFGKSKRGLIMGVWNAHTSIGNISGSLIAAAMLKHGWGWSFVVPGFVIAAVGIMVFMFLPISPDSPGNKDEETDICKPLIEKRVDVKGKPVGFIEAWRIPGVAPFALCLFFCKLVAYTFLYWLPFYISHTSMDSHPHTVHSL